MLAGWSSWGAIPQVFDDPVWAAVRDRLRELTGPGYDAAARTVLNAHYTHPALARVMWSVLAGLGFPGGRVLEPGCGSGLFLATAPAGAQVTGVELDPATALIAAALHPDHEVRAESFVDTPRLGPFDAVIGNVPFSSVVLHDPHHNRAGLSMHNHFLVKSLDLLRPGGVLVALTSRYTLDAADPAARLALAARGDLLAAVRLPTGAHRAMAGTEAVTDLLVLRRHDRGTPAADPGWLDSVPVTELWPDLPGLGGPPESDPVLVNRWWAANPSLLLGRLEVGTGMHGAATLHVRADDPDPEAVAGLLDQRIQAAITGCPLRWTPAPARVQVSHAGPRPPADLPGHGEHATVWTGHLVRHDGGFWVAEDQDWQPLKVPSTQRRELASLLVLRDAAVALVDRESSTRGHDEHLETLRERAATLWRRYMAAHGPLNRATETLRTDAEGTTSVRRTPPPVLRVFARDPHAPLVLALEDLDPASGAARPAPILSRRVGHAPSPPPPTSDPATALAASLGQVGRVDLPRIAATLGVTTSEARSVLLDAGLLFADPGDPSLLHTAASYCSGDVRAKLRTARTAAAADPALAGNVAALAAVQPPELGIDEIEVRLGAAWIPAEIHQQFLRDLLEDRFLTVSNPIGAKWEVRGGDWGPAATRTWGTPRVPAGPLAEMLMTQRPLVVYDTLADDRRVVNADETAALADRAEAMTEQFGSWLWQDPGRASAMQTRYNDLFNGIRLRDYAAEARSLELPGLSTWFSPRPHQREVVARMLTDEAVGIFQVVGAGKTAAIAMGVHELRRVGLVSKPVIVVPNHMLAQFQREWLGLYPHARLLAASSDDLAPRARPGFIAKVATHDWDAIICTHTAFNALPVRPSTEAAYITAQVAEMRGALDALQDDPASRRTRKALERKVLAAEQRRKKLADKRVDPGLTFEATGIDYLVVDEAHLYKNLTTESSVPDLAIPGSARAQDLHLKLWHLRQTGRDRVCALATGTPIANSITEAHVMLRYLAPDLLHNTGTHHFDKWVATFARTSTALEVAPEGGFRPKTRTSHFHNIPELSLMLSTVADVRLAEHLDLPTPTLVPRPDGQRAPQVVAVPANPELATFMAGIAERAEQIRARAVDPSQDNLLKVSTEGRAAALDVRLVLPGTTPTGLTKIEVAAARIAALHHAHATSTYRDEHDRAHPTPGALQLVFADQGTPSSKTNLYAILRDQLVDHGIPREAIRFIHDADTDAAKADLFALARTGGVSVLIGSTEKMGTGMNVQTRLIALHHLDPTWRPSDIEQREGRILRQGNQNPEVHICRYVTEGSFDAFMWQTLERKSGFVRTLLARSPGLRVVEDVSQTAVLSCAEVKAIALGDPVALELATAEADLARLTRQLHAHQRSQTALRQIAEHTTGVLTQLQADQPNVAAAAARTRPTTGTAFAASIAGQQHTDRATAAAAVWATHLASPPHIPWSSPTPHPLGVLAHLGGHPILGELARTDQGMVLTVRADVPHAPAHQLLVTGLETSPTRIIRAAERAAADIADLPTVLATTIVDHNRTLAAAHRDIGTPFRGTAALDEVRARVAALTEQLTTRHDDPLAAADDSYTPTTTLDDLPTPHR